MENHKEKRNIILFFLNPHGRIRRSSNCDILMGRNALFAIFQAILKWTAKPTTIYFSTCYETAPWRYKMDLTAAVGNGEKRDGEQAEHWNQQGNEDAFADAKIVEGLEHGLSPTNRRRTNAPPS